MKDVLIWGAFFGFGWAWGFIAHKHGQEVGERERHDTPLTALTPEYFAELRRDTSRAWRGRWFT